MKSPQLQKNEWWRGCVIYQIYPRSFMDSNGDGVGDLAGIAEQLDHVTRLGADAIWISPFFKSPMKDFGYDVSDYCNVDPVFGTLEDFKKVLERAVMRFVQIPYIFFFGKFCHKCNGARAISLIDKSLSSAFGFLREESIGIICQCINAARCHVIA